MTTLHTMVGAALAAICVFPLAQQGGAQPAKPTVVAVVDLNRAMKSYPRQAQLEGLLSQLGDTGMARMRKLTIDVDEAKARLSSLGADSPDRKQAEFELDMLLRQRDWEAKGWDERIDVERMRFLTLCYEDVGEVINKVAKARGAQLVVRQFDFDDVKGDTATMTPGKLKPYSMLLDRRQVWYSASDIDLTNDVIKELQIFKWKEGAKADAAATGSGTGSSPGSGPGGAKPEQPKTEGTADPKGEPKATPKNGG